MANRTVKICKHCPDYRGKVTSIADGVGGAQNMMGHRCCHRWTANWYMADYAFEKREIPFDCYLQLEYLLLGE